MDNQYFNCERLVRLHGTNPKMGTRPVDNHLWYAVLTRDRTNLSDGELYDMIYYGKRPMVKLEVEYPIYLSEQEALEWFENLSPELRLAQIQLMFQNQ